MLCSRFLKPAGAVSHGRWYRATEEWFQRVLAGYERSLDWVMRHRPLTLVFSVVCLALTVMLFVLIPKGLFPSDDTGLLQATTEAAQGVSYPELVRLQQQAAALVLADSNVEGYLSSVGAGGPAGASNQGRLFIALKPRGQAAAGAT